MGALNISQIAALQIRKDSFGDLFECDKDICSPPQPWPAGHCPAKLIHRDEPSSACRAEPAECNVEIICQVDEIENGLLDPRSWRSPRGMPCCQTSHRAVHDDTGETLAKLRRREPHPLLPGNRHMKDIRRSIDHTVELGSGEVAQRRRRPTAQNSSPERALP